MANRTYRYFTGEVLYPFGYGLSYSKFAYSRLALSSKQWDGKKPLRVTVDVTNTGTMNADEVVQLYASHPEIPNSPIRTLIAFERVHIAKGETQKVVFNVDARSLSTVDATGQRKLVSGKVDLWLGGGQPGLRADMGATAGQAAQLQITHSTAF